MAAQLNDNLQKVILLDFGAQYSHLIARRIRSLHIYCEILPYNATIEEIKAANPSAIIFSGGPSSVLDDNAPKCDPGVFELGLPILGICYGMQLMTVMLGGEAERPDDREYGKAQLIVDDNQSGVLKGINAKTEAWMSHGLQVKKAPAGFKPIAHTAHCLYAAFANPERKFYGVQFHPEVTHTPEGMKVFANFLLDICEIKPNWHMDSYREQAIADIKAQVGDKQVLLGLSGGVDSSVVCELVYQAIGEQLTAVFVDHGLLRKNERAEVEAVFRPRLKDKLIVIDAGERFLSKLAGITDPETKRKIIGNEFIEVFKDAALSAGKLDFLAQGTIYPDVVESKSATGTVIKSHHNVGGLPKDLPFCGLVEPLRYLFKDEVRDLGAKLGLPTSMVQRPPFPGPGLAIRVIGDITEDKLHIVREADAIVREEIGKLAITPAPSQYFAVLTGIRSVGVMGDERSYDYTIAVRSICTEDYMSADWTRIPLETLDQISRRIVNEVRNVNRVVYDITSKPPASVEWE